MVILTDQIGCDDGVCKCNVGIGNNNNCGGGGGCCCCCLADFDVAGCCLGGGDVGFCRNWNVGCGDLLREVVVTRSAVVDVVRGVSSGGIRSKNGSEVVEMWLRDNEAVGSDVEDDKGSEIVVVEDVDGVLSVEDDEQAVDEAERASIDDMIINVEDSVDDTDDTQTNIQVNVSVENMEVLSASEFVVPEVEDQTVKEAVEVVEDDKKSEKIVVMEDVDGVLSVEDDEQSVNEAERTSIDDVIIKVEDSVDESIEVLSAAESDGPEVEDQTVKETVEVIEDDKKSEIVVMEDVDGVLSVEDDEQAVNEAERSLETEATDDHIVAESAVSQKDMGSHCSNEGADYRKEIEVCDDGEQAHFEVKEATVTEQLKVIFPATFVRLDLNIRFGSFVQSGDSDSMFEVSEPETEPECGANINSHEPVLIDVQEDDKNVTFEGVDYLNDGANINSHEPILIDLQENDKHVTCEGLDDLYDGANITNHEPILIDLQEHDKNVTCEGVDDLDDGANINNYEPVLIDLQEINKSVTCEGVDDLDDGGNINNYEPVLIDLQENDKNVTCKGVDDLDDGANINSHEPILIDLQEHDSNVTCEGVDDLDDGQQVGDPINVQTKDDELPPYYYLVKIPQSEDEKLNEQIKSAQLQLDEKTRRRDAISAEHDIKRENMMVHNEAFKAKILELRAARQLVKSKRQQIDDTERIINKVKNAIAVEDINKRVYKAEHMIKHGTLCSEDEKQCIHEIKQLKCMRVQLASNMGSPDEIQHALEQKDQTEELLKNLNTELKTLKDKASIAQMACNETRKKYAEEFDMERELRAQFVAAEQYCKEASEHLYSIKKTLNDKAKRLMDELSEEFSKDYISRYNMLAMQNTQDEPSRVFHNGTDQNVASNSCPSPDEIISTSAVSDIETQKTVKTVKEQSHDQVKENVLGDLEQMMKTEEPVKPSEITDVEVMENTDVLMQEEIEAKLKEEIQLEEKVKANEANERKKQNAEKAQTAEVEAQKEAQQKEKARLKRLRKKERKRAGADATSSSIDNGDTAKSNKSKELENTKRKPHQHSPPPHFLPKQLKPKFIPPPTAVVGAIRNRNRRRWRNLVITVMVLLLSVFSCRSIDFSRLLSYR